MYLCFYLLSGLVIVCFFCLVIECIVCHCPKHVYISAVAIRICLIFCGHSWVKNIVIEHCDCISSGCFTIIVLLHVPKFVL